MTVFMVHDKTDTQTDCSKPLSRKKLRQLMPQNSGLTSYTLSHNHGRKPGYGKNHRRLTAELDALQIESEKNTTAKMTASALSLLDRLSAMFSNRDKSKVAQPHKARRGV